jgi:hypothetical protein
MYHHYWFLKLIDGYVIKAWLPPALLLSMAIWLRYRDGSLRNRFAGLNYPAAFLGAYILFGALSLAWNESLPQAVKYSLILFGPILAFLPALLLIEDNRVLERLILLLFWAGVLLSGYVYYMYDIRGYKSWVGEPFVLRWMWTQHEARDVLSLNYHSAGDYYDYSKTLKHVDEPAFAAMLAPLVLFGFYKAVRTRNWQGWLFYIPSFFLLYTLLGTTSRSSFIAFLFGLAVFLWFIRRKWVHVLLIVLAVAFATYSKPFMLYRMTLLAGAVVSKSLDRTGNQPAPKWIRSVEESLNKIDANLAQEFLTHKDGHVESVSKTFERTRQHPLLGFGIGRLLNEHGDKEQSWHIEHNRYLFIMSTSGLLTIMPYILFIASLVWLSWKYLRRVRIRDKDSFSVGVLFLPVVLLFALQINNCGQERYYYWIFFGFAAAWIQNEAMVRTHENTSH